jgi:hypothetical protein
MPKTIENFGRNVRFTPKAVFKPRTEAELLALLNEHRHLGRSIRVLGAKYSWSEVVACNDVLIDLRDLDHGVRVHREPGGEAWAEIGASGQVKQVLRELDRQGGYTLPAYGILEALSIAGSVAPPPTTPKPVTQKSITGRTAVICRRHDARSAAWELRCHCISTWSRGFYSKNSCRDVRVSARRSPNRTTIPSSSSTSFHGRGGGWRNAGGAPRWVEKPAGGPAGIGGIA